MKVIKTIIFLFAISISSYGAEFVQIGDANSNFEGESPLPEMHYRVAKHIPQHDTDIIVGIVDHGFWKVNYDPLKEKNYWVNDDEIPNNGIDDDGNGYIDDIHGWDYVTDNPDPFEDSLDSHGISIAGIIVDDTTYPNAGINPDAKLMFLRWDDINGKPFSENSVSGGIRYIADNTKDNERCIINMSWVVVDNDDYVIRNAMQHAADVKGCLLLGATDNYDGLNDGIYNAPSGTDFKEYVYTVTGLTPDEMQRVTGEYGKSAAYGESMKFGAPFKIRPGDPTYSYIQGTSFSTPIIVALASLVWGNDPSLTADEVVDKLYEYGTIIEDSAHSFEYKKIDTVALVESYVDLYTKIVETDYDGDGFTEQLHFEISTLKDTGEFNKGYLTHILEEDGTLYSVFQEL